MGQKILNSLWLSIACMALGSTMAYENVYDIIERRNQRNNIVEPRNRYFEEREIVLNRFNDFDTYSAFDRKPSSIYSVIRPIDRNDWYRTGIRGHYGGNGYDNLGNGLVGGFNPFRETNRPWFFREPPLLDNSFRARFRGDHRPIFHGYARPRHPGDSAFDREWVHANKAKGNSAVSKLNSFAANKEDDKQRKLEENFRSNQESLKNEQRSKENFAENSLIDKNSENNSVVRSNKISKKGHLTKGFSTHHHKDETGNTTTFYDEFSDQGGQADFRGVADGFGLKKTIGVLGNRDDEKIFRDYSGQSGNHGRGYAKDNRKSEKDLLSNDNYFEENKGFHSGAEDEATVRRATAGFNHRDKYGGYDGYHGLPPYDNYFSIH